MKSESKVRGAFDRIVDIMMIVAGGLISFVTLFVTVGVITRYVGFPIGWMNEVTEYIQLYIAFLVPAWVLRGDGHVKMDLVLTKLKPVVQAGLNAATSVLGAIICFMVAWYAGSLTVELITSNYFLPAILEFPKAIVVGIIPLGYLMVGIQFIYRATDYVGTLKTHRGLANGR